MVAQQMLGRATEARDATFSAPVHTVAAVIAKLEACEESGVGSILDMRLASESSIYRLIKADIERLGSREAFGEARQG